MTHEKYWGDGDEPHYMMIAHSMVFDRDLDVSNDYSDRSNLISDGNLGERHARTGRNGTLYPDHDIGLPLLMSPWFAASYGIAKYLPERILEKIRLNRWGLLKTLLAFAMILVTGSICANLFELSLRISGAKAASFLGSLLFVLSPPILSHSYLFFTEIVSAAIAIYVYRRIKLDPVISGRAGLVLGFWTAYLFLIHVRNLWLILSLSGFALVKGWEDSRNRAGGIGFAASFFALMAIRTCLNYYLWGRWVSEGNTALHAHPIFLPAVKDMILRLFALSFDQEGGFLIYGPVYAFSFAGLVLLWKESRRTFLEVSTMFFGNYFLIVSFPMWISQGWSGFWSPASRYLVTTSAFLAIPGVIFLSRSPRLAFPAGTLITLQCVLNLFFWQFPKLLWNGGTGSAKFLLFLDPSGFLVKLFPAWNLFSVRALLLSGLLLLLCGLLTIRLLKSYSAAVPEPAISD